MTNYTLNIETTDITLLQAISEAVTTHTANLKLESKELENRKVTPKTERKHSEKENTVSENSVPKTIDITETPKKEITVEQIRAAANSKAKEATADGGTKRELVKSVINGLGADNLTLIKKEDYADFIQKLSKL